MKTAGIIAEYNPFHQGHAYHIAQTRRKTGADAVVCVMSGNFTQRGLPALLHKWDRAGMALSSGADLVIELPVPFALGSAEYFALGGISLLNSLGVVDYVSFGSEEGNLETLQAVADLLDKPETLSCIKRFLKEGLSFPAAREQALYSVGMDNASLLAGPNNILAIEYCRAICRLNAKITPVTVARSGAGYHDGDITDGVYASANALREAFYKEGTAACAEQMPKEAFAILESAEKEGRYYPANAASDSLFLAALKRCTPADFSRIPSVSEGLENRLYRAAQQANTMEEFFASCKTKRYTRTRLNRIAACAYLGISLADCPQTPPYIRVLGMNETGRAILKAAKERATLPILIKPAHIARQNEACRALFARECRATSLWALLMHTPCSLIDIATPPRQATGGLHL